MKFSVKETGPLSLHSTTLGELKVHALPSQLPVDLTVGIKSVVNTAPLLLIQHNLEGLGAIFARAGTLADDLDWVYEVSEDSVVDSGEGTRARALLLLRGAASITALWAGKNAAGC